MNIEESLRDILSIAPLVDVSGPWDQQVITPLRGQQKTAAIDHLLQQLKQYYTSGENQ